MRLLVVALVLALQFHPLLCVCNSSVQWGTFRPQALISVRADVPDSPLFGFMYHPFDAISIRHLSTDDHDKISAFSFPRHDGRSFADQIINDDALNLQISTSFQRHPSKNAWALRISGAPLNDRVPVKPISVVFYSATGPDDTVPTEDSDKSDQPWGSIGLKNAAGVDDMGLGGDVVLEGSAESIGGKYRVIVKEPSKGAMKNTEVGQISVHKVHRDPNVKGSRILLRRSDEIPDVEIVPLESFHVAGMGEEVQMAWAVDHALRKSLKKKELNEKGQTGMYFLNNDISSDRRGVLVQRILQVPFELEVVLSVTETLQQNEVVVLESELTGSSLDSLLQQNRKSFDEKFDKVFSLKEKGRNEYEIEFAKVALSNVLGGIGFFHGSSIAFKRDASPGKSAENLEYLKPVSLFTATPSRALFPRGFLWDEGFHQLVVQRWDPALSRKCMRSWMSAMQHSGWIPREQILGLEARNRFPTHIQHLMVQNPLVANPPTILMPLRFLVSSALNDSGSYDQVSENCAGDAGEDAAQFSRDIFDQSMRYFTWLKKTQGGMKQNSYRWRGRSPDVKSPDGYPLTLASGLDDYPRAESPSFEERHVDLHSWIAWASGVLSSISESAGKDATMLRHEHEQLRNNLIEMHSSPDAKTREDLLLCDYDGDTKICHEGYVTILPLILGLLHPSDARIGAILQSLEDETLLRSPAGIRSLSKADRWHRKGDDYWTGSVWMPFNFLTLAALKTKYAAANGPYKERAEALFRSLQKSILDNALKVFSETGQLWENYASDDGNGKSGRQFTGWSSLIVLMYADMFNGVT